MKKTKRMISIIGTVGVPAHYGGFETLVENILTYTTDESVSYTVYCSGISYKGNKQPWYKHARLRYIPLKANGIQSVLYDIVSILYSFRSSDQLLILGVSGCCILPVVRLFSKKRIIVNIDGLEHKREKWNKLAKSFLRFSESMAVRYADKVIADNVAIQHYVKETYGKEAVMIPYGGNHALEFGGDETMLSRWNLCKQGFGFTVCRIEPENNIHVLLEAYSQLPDQPVVIVGNWNKSTYGKELLQKYGDYTNIHMLEPVYDVWGLNGLRMNCRYYLHGHSAGGTNPSLVEAMNLGLPVIAFDVVYNRMTTDNEAFYFNDSISLEHILTHLSDDSLKRNAVAMKRIAMERYQWTDIVKSYEELF